MSPGSEARGGPRGQPVRRAQGCLDKPCYVFSARIWACRWTLVPLVSWLATLSQALRELGVHPCKRSSKAVQTNRAISWTGSLARECELAWQRYALNRFQPSVPPRALINEHPALPSGHPAGCCCPAYPWEDGMLILALDSSHTTHHTFCF